MENSTVEPATKGVALVTGASAGMGADIACRLLDEGYVVIGAARRVERMQPIEDSGGTCLPLDLTEDSSMVDLVEKVISDQGRIDVLVNCAGYGSYGAIEDIPLGEARRQFEVNVFGLARLTQLVLPHMRKRNFGKIINISSIAGKLHSPIGGWYTASKHALEALSDCLRLETQQFGIDVIVIQPGIVESEWTELALETAREHSGNTAYSDIATRYIKLEKTQAMPSAAPPKAISDLVIKALRARKPKTRYVGGGHAKPLLFLRKFLSDRLFDKYFYFELRRMLK